MQKIEHSFKNGIFTRHVLRPTATGNLLMVHGLGESGLCFEELIHSLLDESDFDSWNIVAPDLPGYGKSLPAALPRNLSHYAEMLLNPSFLPDDTRQFSNLPTVLMGHSMGGVIGQLAAESRFAGPDGFVNVEGNLTLGDCVFSGQAAEYTIDEFKRVGFSVLQKTVYENGVTFPAQRGYYASMRFADPEQFYLNSLELTQFSRPENGAIRFAELSVPSLYISGLPRGICDRSVQCLEESNANVHFCRSSGHWPFIDQLADFRATLRNFLSSTY